MFEHKKFDKIYRYQEQKVVVTEKLDGTNGLVFVDLETDTVLAGSRNRWITPEDDNYGFAKFVQENREDLKLLGDGYHYGEWWGQGIQRRYDMDRKVFSLFNAIRWQEERPICCDVVPLVFCGTQAEYDVAFEEDIKHRPSTAAQLYQKNYENVEGYIIWLVGTQKYMKHIINGEKS